MKLCSKCKKPGKFYKDPRSRDGLRHQCAQCHSVYTKRAFARFIQRNPGYSVRKINEKRALNPGLHAAQQNAWAKKNRHKVNVWSARYEAAKTSAVPVWLTRAQRDEIKATYAIAKDLQWLSNEPLTVDHIIPLRGKAVCGLHVPWNLQILPKSANSRKNNRIE